MTNLTEERLLDLLCKKATDGLDPEEIGQLEQLENAFPVWKDDESFEIAATAINLTAVDPGEKMPGHLRAKILANAGEYFESNREMQKTFNFEPAAESGGGLVSAAENLGVRAKTSFLQWLGWGVAAVACIALAVNLYVTRVSPPELRAGGEQPSTQTPTPQPSDAEKLEQLKISGNVLTAQITEADPKKQDKITGDIVWNNAEQKGYMRFRGLPVNDPNKATYQLWIFDEAQDEKYPIDGGVFDVNKDGEVIIPIDAKINVKKPKMFAVTKEKPGGVVVSDRSAIVALAKV